MNRAPESKWPAWVEAIAIVLLFVATAGLVPPDVNEPNYLAKARHYWDPTWATGDVYLESADTHALFYVACGGLTQWLDLPTTAIVLRLVTWSLMAVGWMSLARSVELPRGGAVLAAGLFAAGNGWANVSGEWVIGGCEAKGFAYAALLFALAAWVQGRWPRTIILLGVAIAWHALVGGWAAIAMILATCLSLRAEKLPRLTALAGAGILGVGLASVGLLPVMLMDRGVPAALVHEAQRIYVFARLPHHLLPEQFTPLAWGAFGTMLGVWGALAWQTRTSVPLQHLHRVTLTTLAIAFVGGVLSAVTASRPDLKAALLRFYWFRAADFFVPLAVGIGGACLVFDAHGNRRRRPLLAAAMCLIVVVHLGASLVSQATRTKSPGEMAVYPNAWREACTWVRAHTPRDARFMTPRSSQTFKWYADRAEVANWKEVPQDARSLNVWWERLQALYAAPPGVVTETPGWRASLTERTPKELRELAERFAATHLLTSAHPGLKLPCIYRNAHYAVYDLSRTRPPEALHDDD